jgi:hypothetical protein
MPNLSVAPRSTRRNMYPNNKVMPVSEWQMGVDARKAHRPITVCGSDEMAAGWVACNDAIGADNYARAAYADNMPFRAVLSVVWGG